MAAPVSHRALTILSTLDYGLNSAKITAGQLPAELYAEVNEVLSRLGGQWKSGRTKAHLFPYDPRPLIAAFLESGELPPKNPLAYFPTPPLVVEEIMAWAEIDNLLDTDLIIDPNAGTGALADAVRAAGYENQLHLVELDPLNVRMLRQKCYQVTEDDFLNYHPANQYRLILMNPPFSVEGDRLAYISHIRHAWKLLEPRGRLIAIAPTGFTFRSNTARTREFLEFVHDHGHYLHLPKDAFRESGTMSGSTLIVLNKLTAAQEAELLEPHSGYRNHYCYQIDIAATSNHTFYEASQELYRQIRDGRYSFNLLGEDDETLVARVQEIYQPVMSEMREQGAMLRMTQDDWNWMTNELVKDYQRWMRETSQPVSISQAA